MEERGIGRRHVLLGAAGALAAIAAGGLLVEEDVLPGRSRAYAVLGLNGDGAPMPTAAPGPRVDGSFASRERNGLTTGWSISYPPGSRPGEHLPVYVVLHGASYDHTSVFDDLGLDRFLALAVRSGVPPFAIAAADGGNTYWRPAEDGSDSGRMLTEEFLPLLRRRGLDVGRLVWGGWSMGGYGALRLAGLGRPDCRAVAVSSPALTEMPSGTPAEDDVYGHPERLSGMRVRIDCGRGDPFYPHVHDFIDELDPAPAGEVGNPGGHSVGYWRSVAPAQLRFVGNALA